MSAVLDATWGPYRNEIEASTALGRYVDRTCGPATGVAWAANGFVYPLRGPVRDSTGLGDVMVFQWTDMPPPPPKPPAPGFWQRVEAFFERVAIQQAQADEFQAQANMAMARTVGQAFNRIFTSHQDDGVGVVLDVICVAASIALIPTGLGAVGLLALAGSGFLLMADGRAYALELAGDEDGARAFKEKTETLRIIATVMTLPDVVVGGARALREVQEARELLQADLTTARAAETMGARATNATRTEQYNQIAQRAYLRSQLRSEQIRASAKLELAPRAVGAGSTALLVREEITEDQSALHEIWRRLQMHNVAVHR